MLHASQLRFTEKEMEIKEKKAISILGTGIKRSGLWTAVRNTFHTRSAVILVLEHENLITRKQARLHIFQAHCHLSVAYPNFTCRRQDEKKQSNSSSQNGWCIHFKRSACRNSLPVSIQCKLAGLESYKLSVPSSVTYYEQNYWAAKIFLVQPIPAFFGSSCSSSLSSRALFHSLSLPCSFSSLAPITTCSCCWSAQIYSVTTNSSHGG